MVHGLSMIVTILNQGEEEEEDLFDDVMDETEAEAEQLSPFLRSIHCHLSVLKDKLTEIQIVRISIGSLLFSVSFVVCFIPVPVLTGVVQEPVNYACGEVRPFGEARLRILNFITSLVRQNTTAISDEIVKLRFPVLFMELMAQYPLNNILHNEVVRFLHASLRVKALRVAICDKSYGAMDSLMDRAVEEWCVRACMAQFAVCTV